MTVSVVLTAVGGGGNGEQLLKALRQSELPYCITGTDVSAYSIGLHQVDRAHLVPRADDPYFMNSILEICRASEADVLIPGSEPELRVLSWKMPLLAEQGLFVPVNPPSVIDICMDKVRTSQFLAEHGFSVPRWQAVRSASDLKRIDFWPAVLKPSVGGGGSNNLFLAQDRDELVTFGSYLLHLYPEFIVQEYVGTPDSEYTVGVLHTMDGQFINSIALRRNLMSALTSRIRVSNKSGREELGPTLVVSSGFSHGDLGPFPEVSETCERIAKAIGARGPLNIQCRLVDGEVVVFEINPRFSGTTSLRAMVGFNEVDLLIRHHVLGEPIEPRFPYPGGRVLRGLTEHLVEDDAVDALPHAGRLEESRITGLNDQRNVS